MTRRPARPWMQTVHFAAGLALLLMLTPHHGKLPEKPAGVRTAIEMISKKTSLRVHAVDAMVAA